MICTQFTSIQPKDRTLSGATISSQSGNGIDGNKGVLRCPQSITGATPSGYLLSYLGYSLGESYPSVKMQLVYFYSPSLGWRNG